MRNTIVCCLFVVAVLWTTNASAASFDCSKAQAADELAVCKNADLSALDSEMGGLWYAYDLLPMLMGSSGARRDDAQQFLHDRASCADEVACLRKVYVARNAALRNDIKAAIQSLPANP